MSFRFSMDQIAFFSSDQASEILHEYREQTEKYADSLRIQTALRSVFPALDPALLQACMTQFALQDRGRKKCALPDAALYTADALEMASSDAAARLHASLLPADGTRLDIAAGIGADAVQLAQQDSRLVCIEADPVHAAMLRHNLRVAGVTRALVLRGTAEHWLPLLKLHAFSGVYADPARRTAAKRTLAPEEYSPPFSCLEGLPAQIPVLIKISPAADVPPGWKYATVAVGRECSEQLLHRNIDLPSVCALHADLGIRWEPDPHVTEVDVQTPRYLIEPHAAIIRTGQVAGYLREHRAEPIDPHIAYGWSEHEPPASDWHQRFRLLRFEDFNRKQLRHIARELDFSAETEIKKRGFPDSPESILRDLKLKGSTKGVIFITRRGDGHVMGFGKRL